MLPLLVATIAPIINCIQLVPQLYHTYTTKKIKDLSMFSLLLILLTNILWFLHGYFIMDISLLMAGIISISINSMLFYLYICYKK